MERAEFLKLSPKEKVEYINAYTIQGINTKDIAEQFGLNPKTLSKSLSRAGFQFSREDKIYKLVNGDNDGNNNGIIKEKELRNNKEVIKEELKRNKYGIIKEEKKALFSNEEVKAIKELLAVKEQLLQYGITPRNNNGISVMEIDRSNRKKATFNMDIELLNELEEYEKKLINISKSDIVNKALKEFLESNRIIKEK